MGINFQKSNKKEIIWCSASQHAIPPEFGGKVERNRSVLMGIKNVLKLGSQEPSAYAAMCGPQREVRERVCKYLPYL